MPERNEMTNVPYMVDDVEALVEFYTEQRRPTSDRSEPAIVVFRPFAPDTQSPEGAGGFDGVTRSANNNRRAIQLFG